MKFSLALVALLYLPLCSAVPPQTETEIAQLLDYISNSGCDFDRNGTHYSAAEARDHIENKYDYTRKYIDTSEEFIDYTATKSSISGRAYQVTCDGQQHNTADWLQQALVSLRRKSAAGQ